MFLIKSCNERSQIHREVGFLLRRSDTILIVISRRQQVHAASLGLVPSIQNAFTEKQHAGQST